MYETKIFILYYIIQNLASKHTHVAKVIEQAAANPQTHKSGESAALLAASSLTTGPGPSLPLLPAPKVWHETLTPEGYSYYWNVDTQGMILYATTHFGRRF